MELVHTEVSTIKSRLLPMLEEAIIIPIGDVQFGSEACDFDRFKRHIEWASSKPNAYFIGMGDYCDFGSPSNRGKLKALMAEGSLYDTVEDVMDEAAEKALAQMLDVLGPTRGRWLGLLEGHHFWQFSDGSTTDTRLCQALEAPFLGTSAIVNVAFDAPAERRQANPRFEIWCHHGRGNGDTSAAPLNRLEKIAGSFPSVSVFLMGHHHKKAVVKKQQLIPVWGSSPKLKHRNIVLGSTGGFLKGYMVGSKRGGVARGGYVEQGMMTPVAMGGIAIYARPRVGDGRNASTVDLDVSV